MRLHVWVDKSHAERVSQKLEGSPLALEQAAVYLDVRLETVTLQEYVEKFNSYYEKTMSTLPDERTSVYGQRGPIFTSVAMLFTALAERNLDTMKLLNVSCFISTSTKALPRRIFPCAPRDTIAKLSLSGPRSLESTLQRSHSDLFQWWKQLLADSSRIHRALEALMSSALVRLHLKNDGRVSGFCVYHMVRYYALHMMSQSEKEEAAMLAFHLLGNLLYDTGIWNTESQEYRLFSNLVFSSWAALNEVVNIHRLLLERKYLLECGPVAAHFAKFWHEHGKIIEAEWLCEVWLEYSTVMFGADWPIDQLVIEQLELYGLILWELGKFDTSLSLLTQALEHRKNRLSLENPATLLAARRLRALRDRAAESEQGGRRATVATATEKRIFDDSNQSVTDTLEAPGPSSDAEWSLREQYEMSKEMLGVSDPHTLNLQTQLAHLYKCDGRISEAIELYNSLREYYSTTHGPIHPLALRPTLTLFECYKLVGQLEDAIQGPFRHAFTWTVEARYLDLFEFFLCECEHLLFSDTCRDQTLATARGSPYFELVFIVLNKIYDRISKRISRVSPSSSAAQSQDTNARTELVHRETSQTRRRGFKNLISFRKWVPSKHKISELTEGVGDTRNAGIHLAKIGRSPEQQLELDLETRSLSSELEALKLHLEKTIRLLKAKADVNIAAGLTILLTTTHLLASTIRVIEASTNMDSTLRGMLVEASLVERSIHGGVAAFLRTCFSYNPRSYTLLGAVSAENARDSNGWTALHWAALYGKIGIVEALLKEGLAVDVKDSLYGRTPLHIAGAEGHGEVARRLMNRRADVEIRDNNNRTPLFLAALRGKEEVVRLLLTRSNDIDARDENDATALHAAALSGHTEVVRLLLKNGANARAKDNEGRTAVHHARSGGHVGIIRLLSIWRMFVGQA